MGNYTNYQEIIDKTQEIMESANKELHHLLRRYNGDLAIEREGFTYKEGVGFVGTGVAETHCTFHQMLFDTGARQQEFSGYEDEFTVEITVKVSPRK